MDKLRLVKGTPFRTIQGEGVLVGTPSTFIRAAGCDLRCVRLAGRGFTCDTPDSLPDFNHRSMKWAPLTRFAHELTPEEAADAIVATRPADDLSYEAGYLVITGGEPMLQANLFAEMMGALWEKHGLHPFTTLETNGRHYDAAFAEWVDLVSISPKVFEHVTDLRREQEAIREWVFHAAHFGKPVQLKVVCAVSGDVDKAEELFAWARGHHKEVECVVQPASDAADYEALCAKVMQQHGTRLIVQSHKILGIP